MKKFTALALCLIFVLSIFAACQKDEPEEEESSGNPVLHYAEGTTVIDDDDKLQDKVDEALDKASQSMVVSYKGDAFSEDGKTVSCYIANSDANPLDMYIGIYKGDELEDQLFLSGLMRPGQAYEEIELEKTLPKGDHECTLLMTQVEDDHATIHGQVALGITIHVS